MSKQYLYFPTKVEDALAFLRAERRLDEICNRENYAVIGYTDRALAVLQSPQGDVDTKPREVCLVVVEIEQEVFCHLLNGDMVHFGPCAKWRSDHALELELTAQMLIAHGGRFSLQIVKA